MRKRWLASAALALLGVNGYAYAALTAPARMHVTPLALAAGSATLITLPDGRALLIGAGGDASVVRALGGALPPWQRHLAALVLPSSDASVAGGAPFILTRYGVGALVRGPARGTALREAALSTAAAAGHVGVKSVPQGTLVVEYQGLAASTTGPYAIE